MTSPGKLLRHRDHPRLCRPARHAIIRLVDAQNGFNVSGTGIVAVIDTGVDVNHPVLYPVLLPGYDFTRNQPGASEWLDVPQLQAGNPAPDRKPSSQSLSSNPAPRFLISLRQLFWTADLTRTSATAR